MTSCPIYNCADCTPRLHTTRHNMRVIYSAELCAVLSRASHPVHAHVPVRDLLLYAGTWQSVLGPGSVLRLSHAPLTSGLWGSQLLKQHKAHYSHCSLQSATVSHPSLGRYTQLLPCFLSSPTPSSTDKSRRHTDKQICAVLLHSITMYLTRTSVQTAPVQTNFIVETWWSTFVRWFIVKWETLKVRHECIMWH